MYSVKPGRGSSLIGGIFGIFFAIFGIAFAVNVWEGAPGFAKLFLLVWIGLALSGVVGSFYNATQKNRVSSFDIVHSHEEVDPIDRALGYAPDPPRPAAPAGQGTGASEKANVCPGCGTPLEPSFEFCPKCGRDV